MYHAIEAFLEGLVNYSILGFEYVGVIVLIISGVKGIIDYIHHSPQIRLTLAEGMALSLEFKLGSEILRTVVVRQLNELVFIGGIILLRAALTYLIHWEIDYEERQNAKNKVCPETQPKKDVASRLLDARFGAEREAQREKARQKYADNAPKQ